MSELNKEGIIRIDVRQALMIDPPPLDYVWPGFLAGTVGVMSASGGSGKSMWLLEALLAVAGGPAADLLELRPCETGRAAYICLEDPHPILLHRLRALGRRFEPGVADEIGESMEVLSCAGYRLDLPDQKQMDRLARALDGVRVAAIDTFSRAHALDENNNSDMSRVLSALEWICSRTGCAIVLVHHTNKAGGRDGGEAQHAARGASALVDNARWGAQLARMTEDEAERLADGDYSPDPSLPLPIRERRGFYCRMSCPKINYGEPQEDRWYKREEGGVLVPARLAPMSEYGAVKRAASIWKGRPERE
jgi:hypothetical protein